MYQTYSNSLYSNTSESSRRGGGRWVYMNGELYHEGKKGMRWGFHLPGTDWWKDVKTYYNKQYVSNVNKQRTTPVSSTADERSLRPNHKTIYTPATNSQRMRARIGAGLSTAKYIGNQAKTKAIDNLSVINNKARISAYQAHNRNAIDYARISSQPMSHIEEYMGKQLRDGEAMFKKLLNSKENKGINTINLAIQNAQYNIVKGVNNFLKATGLDVKVDQFLSKILKKNSSAEWNRRKKTSTIKGPGSSSAVTKPGSGSSGKSPRYQTR